MSPAPGTGTGSRRVTIRSMSCRGVKAFVPFQKPPLYAAVSLGGRREKTPADADGGENPDWDGAAVAFDLDGVGGNAQEQEQLLRFEVKAQVPLLGNKLVGTASVPVADLAAAAGGDGAGLRHVSYQVSAPDGKPNGTLSFAYAITSELQHHAVPVPDGAVPQQGQAFFSAPPPPVTAYPAPSSTATFAAPHGGVYPPQPSSPPASGSLYPPLQDLLPSSTYPPPPLTLPHHHFPGPNSSSSYPPPPQTPGSVYPSPPSAQSSVYPPPAAAQDSVYPPSEPGSAYHLLPRSAPSPSSSSTVDRELAYHPAPSPTTPSPPGASYYPPPELINGAARTAPYYYSPPAGPRYP